MSRGRRKPGPQPADQPWTQTADRKVWQAVKYGLTLTVTNLSTGGWVADIEGPGVARRSPLLATRSAAQTYAEVRARDLS